MSSVKFRQANAAAPEFTMTMTANYGGVNNEGGATTREVRVESGAGSSTAAVPSIGILSTLAVDNPASTTPAALTNRSRAPTSNVNNSNSSSNNNNLMAANAIRGSLHAAAAAGRGYQRFGDDDPAAASIADDIAAANSNASTILLDDTSGIGSSRRTLTTFSGVFAPVTLSMFAALLLLRMGFVVGQAGVWQSLVQLGIAYGIVFFTVLSICAVSSNGAVEGGGVYFMISRALGPEFGGAIGTIFYLANTFSAALYCNGCVESLMSAFGTNGAFFKGRAGLMDGHWYRFLYACGIAVLGVLVCAVGARLFARTSIVVLIIVAASYVTVIVSFFFKGHVDVAVPVNNHQLGNNTENITLHYNGLSSATFNDNWEPNYAVDYSTGNIMSFTSVFAILFTGVTGVMAGANMSGELKNPGKSIPHGTLAALCTTLLVYLSLIFLIASTCSNMLLKNDYLFLEDISLVPYIIFIGTFVMPFFSSLSGLIGASRVLEALARDDLVGLLRPFGYTSKSGNPIVAVLFTFMLMILVLLIPAFNTIASIASIFFLLAYACVNLACLALEMASAPNWRPSFGLFTWHTCTLGIIGSLVMTFLINPAYAAAALLLMVILLIALHLWTPEKNWGSISQAIIFHQVRKYLLMLDPRKQHVKYWRPQILLLVSRYNTANSVNLIAFVNDLKKGGLFVLGHVYKGMWQDMTTDPTIDEYPRWLDLVDKLRLKAFIELTVAPTVRDGLHHLVHLSGLGGMKPNTIILGFPRHLIAPVPKQQSADMFTLSDRIDQHQRISSGNTMMGNSFMPAAVETLNPASLLDFTGVAGGGEQQAHRRASAGATAAAAARNAANYAGINSFSNDFTSAADAAAGNIPAVMDDDLLLSFGSGGISLDEPLSSAEFMSILLDCHRMQKNICVARNFINLNKQRLMYSSTMGESSSIFTSEQNSTTNPASPQRQQQRRPRGGRACYFDVWPIDFTNPQARSQYDSSSLFMLQLSCIVAMTQAWKRRAWVRVFLPISASDGEAIEARHFQLERLLSVLRIKAQVERVYWDDQLALLGGGGGRHVRDSLQLPTEYLAAVRTMVTMSSRDSTVTFMYLPPAPRPTAGGGDGGGGGGNVVSDEKVARYMTQIETLSDIGVPVLMVHAVHMVTTTML